MVVVFGSINADLVARVAALPREGETGLAREFEVHAGGKGANQALAARRAGADVVLVGAVGTDSHADAALRHLRQAGVDLAAVRIIDTATGLALIHVDDAGRNTITAVSGANARLRADDVPATAIRAHDLVVAQLEVPVREVAAVFARARAARATTLLNFAPPAPLVGGLLETTDVLVVNEHEAAALAAQEGLPGEPPAFAAAAADRYGLVAIVTLGAQGAIAATRERRIAAAAASVAVRDTTAAGDAFVGAFAASLSRGDPLERALAEGLASGSHACTTNGAQPSIAPRDAWAGLVDPLLASQRREPR